MKKNVIIFGSIIVVLLMMLTPCVSAVNIQSIENSIKEKNIILDNDILLRFTALLSVILWPFLSIIYVPLMIINGAVTGFEVGQSEGMPIIRSLAGALLGIGAYLFIFIESIILLFTGKIVDYGPFLEKLMEFVYGF